MDVPLKYTNIWVMGLLTSSLLFFNCVRECFAFQEIIYQRSLEIELSNQGLSFVREFDMPVLYKGEPVGSRRVDFFVQEKIMVEIKAIITLEDVHLAQAINYLEAYNIPIGLLINFGAPKLQFKRVMKPIRNLS